MARVRNFPIISADSHFTEPADLWLNYIEPKYRDRAPHVERHATTDVLVCDGAPMFPIGVFHGVRYKGGDVQFDGRYEDIPASSYDPEARLVDLAVDGVTAEVLYPTVAMRFFNIADAAFGSACMRAYNSFAADFCMFAPDRFKAIAVIHLDDMTAAIAELNRAKELGLVGAMIAVFPDDALPYHDPHYDPFWAEAEKLGLPVSLHVSTERRLKDDRSATETFLGYQVVQHIMIGMIFAGTFDKFPNLQLVSVENDAGWAAHLIERMDYVTAKARSRNLLKDHHNEHVPSHYWHNNVHYTFMRDRTAILARHIIGVDRLMWSSDFPHGDSTWPDSQRVIDEEIGDIPLEEQQMILHDNAAHLYGFKTI
ncbi:MAG TPA: amidohydrolase family protein [Acidimicrobiales bacterium]|nr:amidohydrolase family protein [Acidimicrobiales bacterium]